MRLLGHKRGDGRDAHQHPRVGRLKFDVILREIGGGYLLALGALAAGFGGLVGKASQSRKRFIHCEKPKIITTEK